MSFYGKIYNYITGAFNKISFKNTHESSEIIEVAADTNQVLTMSAGNNWLEFKGQPGNDGEIIIQHKEVNNSEILKKSINLAFYNSETNGWDIYPATLDKAGHLNLNTENVSHPTTFITFDDDGAGKITIGDTQMKSRIVYDGGVEEDLTE